MSSLIDEALDDFPESEIWRLQTDGWQATRGPENFRPQFYEGMNAGFDYLRKLDRALITPELIEGIYHSAFSSEDEYQKNPILKKGFHEKSGAFEIFLPLPGLENTAGVSLAGIPELVVQLKDFMNSKGSKSFPYVELLIEGSGLPLSLDLFSNQIEQELLQHLNTATLSKEDYSGSEEKTATAKLCRVLLVTSLIKREELLQLVQEDIDNYYQQLAQAQLLVDVADRQTEELKAINYFIRKLHQTHYFPDGNGRSFVFLLFNLLLLQNGYELKITQTPAHYAAFSSEELLFETRTDLLRFQAYKITKAKNFLATLVAQEINDDKEFIKSQLAEQLNSDPLIAMAQINELFIRIEQNKLTVPKGYIPSNSLFSWLNAQDEKKTAHLTILKLLQELYIDQLNLLITQQPSQKDSSQNEYNSKPSASTVLKAIFNRQKITQVLEANLLSKALADYELQSPQEHFTKSTKSI
ncbi:MAG: hypothetical protein H0U70_06930 [Tatlockia sp.]|nr:hypothetical protein [Tatlockia sp.]